jgi:SAM-dependent methyltransferase
MFLTKFFLGDNSKIGLSNKDNRGKWLAKTIANIPNGESILDAGAGELQNKPLCNHLIYTSQDFAQYNGSGDGKGIQTGEWDNTKLDIISDITKIPVPSNSFQNILCSEVLEHVPDPVQAMKELVRVLKPGGKLIITVPFASLTHFAPYHFASGLNKYFFSHWSEKLDLEIIEISFNGNYFEFVGQELRYSVIVSENYANNKISFVQKIALRIMLSWFQKSSERNRGSEELLAFGVQFIGKKK